MYILVSHGSDMFVPVFLIPVPVSQLFLNRGNCWGCEMGRMLIINLLNPSSVLYI